MRTRKRVLRIIFAPQRFFYLKMSTGTAFSALILRNWTSPEFMKNRNIVCPMLSSCSPNRPPLAWSCCVDWCLVNYNYDRNEKNTEENSPELSHQRAFVASMVLVQSVHSISFMGFEISASK